MTITLLSEVTCATECETDVISLVSSTLKVVPSPKLRVYVTSDPFGQFTEKVTLSDKDTRSILVVRSINVMASPT